jgi:hypothetical protein
MRQLPDDARPALDAGLRRHEAVSVRRGQMVGARAEGQQPATLATTWHGAPPTVRHGIPACAARGRACVPRGSPVPIRVALGLNAATQEPVRALLHPSPRHCGPPARVWTRPWRAEAGHEPGLSPTTRSWPMRLEAIVRVDITWTRATPGIVSPDPADACNTRHAIGCSGSPPTLRTAPWALQRTSGGVVRPRPRGLRGATARLSAWWNTPCRPRTRQATPWPVMGALCPRPPPGGDALSTGVPSARSPGPGWPGLPPTWPPPAHGHSGAAGTRPPGPSARRGRPGSRATIVKPNRTGAVA